MFLGKKKEYFENNIYDIFEEKKEKPKKNKKI